MAATWNSPGGGAGAAGRSGGACRGATAEAGGGSGRETGGGTARVPTSAMSAEARLSPESKALPSPNQSSSIAVSSAARNPAAGGVMPSPAA